VDMHDEKTFTYLGRKDNVINSGGVKISPEVVEEKLAHHIPSPFFLYGVPDKVLGQKLVMIVEGEETSEAVVSEQLATCDSLEKFEIPKSTHFVSEILRNNGKYLRDKTVEKYGIA
jgi:O-succinylbenzoic acid--CoA ligase